MRGIPYGIVVFLPSLSPAAKRMPPVAGGAKYYLLLWATGTK